MPQKKIEVGLTQGLLAGYGGRSVFGSILRNGFSMKNSHVEDSNINYHDEWFPGENGGGQELLKTDEELFTRLYAGGVVNQKDLTNLGITEKEVIDELIRRIQELGADTRLFANCNPDKNGSWGYTYSVLNVNPEVNLTIAKEVITYNDNVVFVHGFLLSPLK